MSDKKSYSPPQIFQVELNHEQAILSACAVGYTSLSNKTGTFCRTFTSCRNNTKSTGGTSASPPS
jgi:hypothetical protein